MSLKCILIINLFLFTQFKGLSQNVTESHSTFSQGLEIGFGIVSTHIKDSYISESVYSGDLTNISVSWSSFKSNRGYRLGLTNNFSTGIYNHNISAEYEQTAFQLDYIYRINSFSFLTRETELFIGPGIELYDYYLKHSFASNVRSETEGKINSLGLNLCLLWNAHDKIGAEGRLRTSILSFTNKSFDHRRYPDSDIEGRIVPFYNSLNLCTGMGVRFLPAKKFALKVEYAFQFTMISEWDEYISINHILGASANYTF